MFPLEFKANSYRILLEILMNVFLLRFHLLGRVGEKQNIDEKLLMEISKKLGKLPFF